MVRTNSEQSFSLWEEIPLPTFPTLSKDLSADVCIVGAGIVGLTCAYTLVKQGKSVVVIDKGPLHDGQTIRTSAHLSWALDDRYFDLEKYFGEDGARLAAESHSKAIDYIEQIIRDEAIDCDFERVDGYLFVSPEDSIEILDKEWKALKNIGLTTHRLSKSPIESFDTGSCIHFPQQAQFHIVKYINGLFKALEKYHCKIFTVKANYFEDGEPCIVGTDSGFKISCQSIIVATCTPENNRFIIHTKQAPFRTYVIAAAIPKGSVATGLYWDTADPYHYIRIQKHLTDPEQDWLIIGGEDHKVGQDDAPEFQYAHLEKWAKTRFPMIKDISYKWSGQVFEPIDCLAYIGRNPLDKNIYMCTGDSGNGLTHGTIAGILIPDLILGKDNPWEKLYHPSRKTISAAGEFIKENANTFAQYKDWLTPGEHVIIEKLAPNMGVVLREGLKKIAVYKDEKKRVHIQSALCPHLGACVRWNSAEKSWDCPAHGSRFDGCGTMLNGPAIGNLNCYNEEGKHEKK